ncbi:type 1 glycerol-3-phosphate oxidase [Vagococcus salmoninarum]|uniref:type 1 glycerol-3-phosphate oxidase n=1 Tax=Vagococcus salmoninarum TaxID=2739 RepID=UPI00188162ED|nr:type 1 glycerol-3-phosphate oxidase [Vagococcus salmoninarum]MBE9389854.1 type 1 glycerol-3-phosphate oxidase [Vagococcus salmoninarum]
MAFSLETRQTAIATLKKEELDVLIIGGGITGAGVALQASAAGMKTGLIEMQDFAEGTSSRSTKLVHGGIRYLKNFDVEVVSDTVTERAVVQGIAPHIPKPAPMLLPIYDEASSTFNMFSVKIAMDLYDQLANVTGKYANYTLTAEEVLKREPYLRKEGLLGGGVYLDFKNNDARLVIENIKQAASDGGQMVSRVKAIGFIYKEQQIAGVIAKDLLTGEEFEIKAKVVINTSGPWVDKIRELRQGEKPVPQIRPTKGVHLVIDSSRLTVPQPTYLDTGKNDGRMFFVVPREDKTYFGTTDTDYQGDYAKPTVEQADVDYLLECVNYRYPEAKITLADIESSWVGLRPLISTNGGSDYNGGDNGKISDKSFEEVIQVVNQFTDQKVDRLAVEEVLNNLESSLSESGSSPSAVSRGSDLTREADGLITLSGGKITDYRKMAEGAMTLIQDILLKEYQQVYQLVDSKTYQVSGGKIDPTKVDETLNSYLSVGIAKGLTEKEAIYLADLYGSNVCEVFNQNLDMSMFEGLSLRESLGLNYAMEQEMTLTPADYLVRRTNHLLFIRDTLDIIKGPVVEAMAKRFNWTKTEKLSHIEELTSVINESDLINLKRER